MEIPVARRFGWFHCPQICFASIRKSPTPNYWHSHSRTHSLVCMRNFPAKECGHPLKSTSSEYAHMHRMCDDMVLWRHRRDDLLCCRTFATGEQQQSTHTHTHTISHIYAYAASSNFITHKKPPMFAIARRADIRFPSDPTRPHFAPEAFASNPTIVVSPKDCVNAHTQTHTARHIRVIPPRLVGKTILRFSKSTGRQLQQMTHFIHMETHT